MFCSHAFNLTMQFKKTYVSNRGGCQLCIYSLLACEINKLKAIGLKMLLPVYNLVISVLPGSSISKTMRYFSTHSATLQQDQPAMPLVPENL